VGCPAGCQLPSRPSLRRHDLAGQVQDGGIVVQYEVGVGGQDDPVQLEREPLRVLTCGEFALLDRGGREAASGPDRVSRSGYRLGNAPLGAVR
jgi:hypothetical protein